MMERNSIVRTQDLYRSHPRSTSGSQGLLYSNNPVSTTLSQNSSEKRSERDRIRARLLEAGWLVEPDLLSADVIELSPEALLEVGRLKPGERSTAELLDEIRG